MSSAPDPDRVAQRLVRADLRARPHHPRVDPAGDDGARARRPPGPPRRSPRRPARSGSGAGGVQVGRQVVAPGYRCPGRCPGTRRPPARPARSAGRHDGADQVGRDRPAGRATRSPRQQGEAGEPVAAELRCGRVAPARRASAPSCRPSRRAAPAMSGARSSSRGRQVGVGVADQDAPAGDPVLAGARRRRRCRAGRPARRERCARSPTWATTCSAEVAGVDRDAGRAAEPERRRAGPAPGPAAARCRPGTAPWAGARSAAAAGVPSPAARITAQIAVT